MKPLAHLFEANRAWVEHVTRDEPAFFEKLANQQSPEYLWIGCSDSRVPANQITGLAPGQVFVHRNIANVVVHTDLNALSVIQFAVDHLKVRHIIVVGHYGCSGVHAALSRTKVGLADNWLRHLKDVRDKHASYLGTVLSEARQQNALTELNVIEQVRNVCYTSSVQDAWTRGQAIENHGWVYGVSDGLLRDLDVSVSRADEIESQVKRAVESLKAKTADSRADSGANGLLSAA
jgi:carbonic anhydrase